MAGVLVDVFVRDLAFSSSFTWDIYIVWWLTGWLAGWQMGRVSERRASKRLKHTTKESKKNHHTNSNNNKIQNYYIETAHRTNLGSSFTLRWIVGKIYVRWISKLCCFNILTLLTAADKTQIYVLARKHSSFSLFFIQIHKLWIIFVECLKSTENTKKLNRIGFYRNSIGRCSSHAERFSILLSNISLNMNRMNNICALNSFDLKCVEYYVWFYFILLCFFCVSIN